MQQDSLLVTNMCLMVSGLLVALSTKQITPWKPFRAKLQFAVAFLQVINYLNSTSIIMVEHFHGKACPMEHMTVARFIEISVQSILNP